MCWGVPTRGCLGPSVHYCNSHALGAYTPHPFQAMARKQPIVASPEEQFCGSSITVRLHSPLPCPPVLTWKSPLTKYIPAVPHGGLSNRDLNFCQYKIGSPWNGGHPLSLSRQCGKIIGSDSSSISKSGLPSVFSQ